MSAHRERYKFEHPLFYDRNKAVVEHYAYRESCIRCGVFLDWSFDKRIVV